MPVISKDELKESQIQVEQAFSRKGIKKAVTDYMDTIPEVAVRIDQGVRLIEMWCEAESAYKSKGERRAHISQMDLKELVTDVFVHIASLTTETTLNNLASQLAPMMGFSDTRVGIQAMAEIIAILCETNFFDLKKYHVHSSIYVHSNFGLPDELVAYVERACYLPPMITKPKKLYDNRSSGYLTLRGDSLILGGGHNHHSDPIALDVLNLVNSYRLCLNEDMLDTVEELPTHDLDTVEGAEQMTEIQLLRAVQQQKKNWEKHLKQSAYFYNHIRINNNLMFLNNKYDKRGRLYSQGYHINPQGTSYKKAIIDLYDKEVIEVPNDYFHQL